MVLHYWRPVIDLLIEPRPASLRMAVISKRIIAGIQRVLLRDHRLIATEGVVYGCVAGVVLGITNDRQVSMPGAEETTWPGESWGRAAV